MRGDRPNRRLWGEGQDRSRRAFLICGRSLLVSLAGFRPWYNAEGDLIAQHLAQLHGAMSKLAQETAVTESAEQVNPELHEILTGSRPDGTAFAGDAKRTCGNWTSSAAGSAQVGYFDRAGSGENPNSWNSARATNGCSEEAFHMSGGSGLFYCFAIN
jgi:hypothetical protein